MLAKYNTMHAKEIVLEFEEDDRCKDAKIKASARNVAHHRIVAIQYGSICTSFMNCMYFPSDAESMFLVIWSGLLTKSIASYVIDFIHGCHECRA